MAKLRHILLGALALAAMPAVAEQTAEAVPSVQENIAAMDKDGDGMASVIEVRAFIEARYGKHYQAAVLDAMEASATGRSCGTPFAGFIY